MFASGDCFTAGEGEGGPSVGARVSVGDGSTDSVVVDDDDGVCGEGRGGGEEDGESGRRAAAMPVVAMLRIDMYG